jgi:hypothetical protein
VRPSFTQAAINGSLPARIGGEAGEQGGLTVTTRGHEPAVVAAHRPLQQFARLLVAIEQLFGWYRLAVAKWIFVLFYRAISLAIVEQNIAANKTTAT